MAFGCTPINSIEIPATVKEIKCNAFQSCKELSLVSFQTQKQEKKKGISSFKKAVQYLFDKSVSNFVEELKLKIIISIEFPASVETIESKAL